MRPALIIIDLQMAWYNEQSKASYDASCTLLNEAKLIFEQHNYPVYYIQHQNIAAGIVKGQATFEFVPPIAPTNQPVFVKSYGNAFNKTGLLDRIHHDGVDTLIIGGYRAENCILSTYRGALDLDLTPILLRGAIAGPIADRIKFVEDISEIVSLQALKRLMAL